MNLMKLAQRIRQYRLARDMTLEVVAEQSGLTRSFLSKVENFRATPSLPALGKIASALGVSLSQLVDGLDENPSWVIVRREERQRVERDRPDSRMVYFALAHKRATKAMEPFLLEIPPGVARKKMLSHEQEEFIMVAEGQVDCHYADENFQLAQGDCMYAEGGIEHTINNPGEQTARLLIVYATAGTGGISAR